MSLNEPFDDFIPYEIIIRDGRDPAWIEIQDKNEAIKRFKSSNNNSQHIEHFQPF